MLTIIAKNEDITKAEHPDRIINNRASQRGVQNSSDNRKKAVEIRHKLNIIFEFR